MGASVEFTFNLADILKGLGKVESAVTDLTPFWESRMDALVRGWMKEQFETAGAAGGHKWKELSPTTLKLKARAHREKMGILRSSDTLYRSLVFRSHPDQVKIVEPTSFTFGTAVNAGGKPYPAYHQGGYPLKNIFKHKLEPPHQVPARPIVPAALPSAWQQALDKAMGEYLTAATAQTGGPQ